MNRQILVGDVLEELDNIPEKSIDCVITSPPYWGLRDYGVEGQWGLEPDFHDYLKSMQVFMEALSRVLKDTGTVWINLGDTYAGGFAHGDWSGVDKEFHSDSAVKARQFKAQVKDHLQAKSRYGIPERFYINCIDNGWIARNHIPWYKSNSMPSSVKDRFTNKWESIFFFAKQQRYYFNLDAVREKAWTETKPFNIRVRENITGHAQAKLGDRSWTASEEELDTHNEKGERLEPAQKALLEMKGVKSGGQTGKHGYVRKGEKYDVEPESNVSRLHRDREHSPHKQDNTLGADGKPKANYKGFNDRWAERKHSEQTIQREHFGEYDKEGNLINNPNGKNPGDVFFINPHPFPEAHFATFPVELPLKILKCACPEKICKECGHTPVPIKKPSEQYQKILDAKPWENKGDYDHMVEGSGLNSIPDFTHNYSAEYITTGYTKCECNADYESGIVLDPFFGAGTVGIAAERLGMNWMGIELNEKYVEIARKRLSPKMNERLNVGP